MKKAIIISLISSMIFSFIFRQNTEIMIRVGMTSFICPMISVTFFSLFEKKYHQHNYDWHYIKHLLFLILIGIFAFITSYCSIILTDLMPRVQYDLHLLFLINCIFVPSLVFIKMKRKTNES
jgi:hypothetical protein